MIYSLNELNDVINNVVNRMVEVGTQRTSSGQYFLSHDHVADLISYEDYLNYIDFIESEFFNREEILDVARDGEEFDCVFGLAYCPHYEWIDGDEEVFDMSFDEWCENYEFRPVHETLSLNRLAEIGQAAIPYILETSDMAIEDLTECLGISMKELEALGIYDAGEPVLEAKEKLPLDEQIQAASQKASGLDHSKGKDDLDRE